MHNKGHDILIADDDPSIRMLICEYLTTLGYSVDAVGDGLACLDSIGRELPKLLILDLHMPGMSGASVLESLRSGEVSRDLPVILLSADLADGEAHRACELASISLQKPFQLQDLLRLVEKWVPTGGPAN